jgi:hypothetical protein
MATEVQNQIPASAQPIAVELTTGEKISAERAVRWLDVRKGKFVYQVELDGKQYLGELLPEGLVHLL